MRRGCELALVALAGCAANDGVDLTGYYDVDSQIASEPCGTDTPVAQPWPFLKLTPARQTSGFVLQRCVDDAGVSCAGEEILDSFPRPTEDGWIGEVFTAGGSPCAIYYILQSARLDGDHLVVVIEEHSQEVTPAACTVEEAELRNSLLPCQKHTRFDATRL